MLPIRILHPDAEFEALVPPLAQSERDHLEASLREEGCKEPLVIWAGENIILDGHNRFRICTAHNIPFRTVDLALPDRDAARDWVIARQFSRRNLSPQGASYLRGKRYLSEKRKQGGDHTSAGATCQNGKLLCDPSGTHAQEETAQRLAREYCVGKRTICRDAEFAAAVDSLAATCGPDARRLILAGDARLRRNHVPRLTLLPEEEQKRLFEEFLAHGRLPRLAVASSTPQRISVPTAPDALARTLVERLGRAEAAILLRELGAILEEVVTTADAA